MPDHIEPIYLDHNSTTPLDPRVLDAMLPYFREHYGNAASNAHAFGWLAEGAVEQARAQVAAALGATDREIVFTSGATESNNLALKGVAEVYRNKGGHIITQATEHPAILDPARHLRREGLRITVLPVDEWGLIEPDQVAKAINDDTIMVSIMAANNEIGTVQPLAAIAKICAEHGILFHTDATQALGRMPLDVNSMGIHLLSISGHKVYGPKGVGALYVRRRNPRVRLAAQLHGGGHEHGTRSGTLNVPAIVGLGKAVELAEQEMATEGKRLTQLRDRLHEQLQQRVGGVTLNGHSCKRLPNTLNVSFDGVDAENLMTRIAPIAVSTGSACTSATKAPSHVLAAIGADPARINNSIRFSLGRFNTTEEVDSAITAITEKVTELRGQEAGMQAGGRTQ